MAYKSSQISKGRTRSIDLSRIAPLPICKVWSLVDRDNLSLKPLLFLLNSRDKLRLSERLGLARKASDLKTLIGYDDSYFI